MCPLRINGTKQMAKRKLQTWVEFCLSNKEIRLHSYNFYNMKLDSSLSNISSRKKAQKKTKKQKITWWRKQQGQPSWAFLCGEIETAEKKSQPEGKDKDQKGPTQGFMPVPITPFRAFHRTSYINSMKQIEKHDSCPPRNIQLWDFSKCFKSDSKFCVQTAGKFQRMVVNVPGRSPSSHQRQTQDPSAALNILSKLACKSWMLLHPWGAALVRAGIPKEWRRGKGCPEKSVLSHWQVWMEMPANLMPTETDTRTAVKNFWIKESEPSIHLEIAPSLLANILQHHIVWKVFSHTYSILFKPCSTSEV